MTKETIIKTVNILNNYKDFINRKLEILYQRPLHFYKEINQHKGYLEDIDKSINGLSNLEHSIEDSIQRLLEVYEITIDNLKNFKSLIINDDKLKYTENGKRLSVDEINIKIESYQSVVGDLKKIINIK